VMISISLDMNALQRRVARRRGLFRAAIPGAACLP
jgi:hypothetical protein